jgi:N-acetylneuraminic acid mutarotase
VSNPNTVRFLLVLIFLTSATAGPVDAEDRGNAIAVAELTPLPSPATSFGAAVTDEFLYVYGGHLGAAHKYSADQQTGKLWRLNLTTPDAWEVVCDGPRRTGLAMVTYNGCLYRIGGFEARNAAGEEWDLYSQRDFARFDPKSGQWQELEPLPVGRSSHDAAVLGSKVYVIGGWTLDGGRDGDWHETAYVCDLTEKKLSWREIAKPPFNRRALAVAAWNGRIYVIGGMDDSNDTTTATNVYDPQADVWSDGPTIPGKGFDGFGASAFGVTSGLYATTGPGNLYRLSDDGTKWEQAGKLNRPRMFHRLVAAGDDQLLVVGGTSRGGKVKEVESLRLSAIQPAR